MKNKGEYPEMKSIWGGRPLIFPRRIKTRSADFKPLRHTFHRRESYFSTRLTYLPPFLSLSPCRLIGIDEGLVSNKATSSGLAKSHEGGITYIE